MHINQPGGAGTFCPQCRQKKAYDAELVAQPALENAANAWRAARPFLMSQWHMLQKRENEVHQVIENKRKAETSPSERRLRPRTRHVAETPEPEDVDYRALDSAHIVQCPICFGSFDAVALNKHLDEGCGGPSAAGPSSAPPASMDAWLGNKHSSLWEGARRLTRPQYQLKSERDLRKMLDTHGLSTMGQRDRLVERHRQWVNLYNANLDAAPALREPVSSLRRQLQVWERALDSDSAKGVSSERQARAWLKSHQSQYAELAAQARASLAPLQPPSDEGVSHDTKASLDAHVSESSDTTSTSIDINSLS